MAEIIDTLPIQTQGYTIPPHSACESEIDTYRQLSVFKARWFAVKELRPQHKKKLKCLI